MPSHSERRDLPYTAEQMFDLVLGIEKYPEFLPWCLATRINKRAAALLEADVIIGYKVYKEKFSSRVRFVRAREIEVEYLKGPMRHLRNKWVFKNLKTGGCQVDFHVDFSLKSKLFEDIVDQFFHRALSKMIGAFEARAAELYSQVE